MKTKIYHQIYMFIPLNHRCLHAKQLEVHKQESEIAVKLFDDLGQSFQTGTP